jgi:hypothetical protein
LPINAEEDGWLAITSPTRSLLLHGNSEGGLYAWKQSLMVAERMTIGSRLLLMAQAPLSR